MKLLVDMNLSPRWIALLNDSGFGATHWSTVGAASASDCEIMVHAAVDKFVVLTHGLDFGAILAATRVDGPSVVQIRAAVPSPEIIGAKVVAALRQMRSELEAGALVTVDPERTRLRLLPLRRNE